MCLIKNIVYWLNFVLMLVKKGGYTSCAFQTSSNVHQPDLIKCDRLFTNLRRRKVYDRYRDKSYRF